MISSKMRLPATASGDPDWQFMEDFIKSLNHKPLSTSNKVCSMPKWDEFTWRSFSVGSIFSIEVPRVLFLGVCLDFYYCLRRVLVPKFGFHFDRGSVSQALVKPRLVPP